MAATSSSSSSISSSSSNMGTKFSEEILFQRERRVKKFGLRKKRRIRAIFRTCLQLSDFYGQHAQRLQRSRRDCQNRKRMLRKFYIEAQNLMRVLEAFKIQLNKRNDILLKQKEELDEHQQLMNDRQRILDDIAMDLDRREEMLVEREAIVTEAEGLFRLDRATFRIKKTHMRKLNDLLLRESRRIINLERQESRPIVRVPPRGGYSSSTSHAAAAMKNSFAPSTNPPMSQFELDLSTFLGDNVLNMHNMEDFMEDTIAERNRVREEARIVQCRALRDQIDYIWRDTSAFMRRVFEYYPLTSDEHDQYVNERDKKCDDALLRCDSDRPLDRDDATSQLAMARDIRVRCYQPSNHFYCNITRHIASPFCLRAENYGLSASTTATYNCIERHTEGRMCTSTLYDDDERLPEDGAPFCTSVTEPPSVAEAKIYLLDKSNYIIQSSNEDANEDQQIRYRRSRLNRDHRAPSPTMILSTVSDSDEVCSRDSFKVRRRMNRMYNPFAWMYPNGHRVTTEQLCCSHLNLGQIMQPFVQATLHYQRYNGTITEDLMRRLFDSWLISLCGSACMFSLLTTLRFDNVSVKTLDKFVRMVMICYANEANYESCGSLTDIDGAKLRNEINSKYLRAGDWSTRLPNFVGERTGAIWMMFDNEQFFGRLWSCLSDDIPHVRTHVSVKNSNERAFRYRVHSTVSMICVLMARLARNIAVGDYDVFPNISAEFSRLVSSDRVCLAPFSFFCSKKIIREELCKAIKHIASSELDFKINMYAIAYILRVRDIDDAELGQAWLTYRRHSSVNEAELRIRDIVELDATRIRDNVFASRIDNNKENNSNNKDVSDQMLVPTSITALSIRSIVINDGLNSVRMAFKDLTVPIDYIILLARYFTDCMWHFVSELPITTCTEYEPCRKCDSCSYHLQTLKHNWISICDDDNDGY